MGAKFFESTLPALVDSINNTASKLEKLISLMQFDEAGALRVNTMPPTVFVVRYSHKHGNDVWAKRTKDKALASIADCMLFWVDRELDHAPDAKKEVRGAIEKGDIARAMQLWESNTNEYFEITETLLDQLTENEEAAASKHR